MFAISILDSAYCDTNKSLIMVTNKDFNPGKPHTTAYKRSERWTERCIKCRDLQLKECSTETEALVFNQAQNIAFKIVMLMC